MASVKLLDDSSRCILLPQFCDKAFASYTLTISACYPNPQGVASLQVYKAAHSHFGARDA